MTQHKVHSYLQGRLLMVGCGSIGQAVLPLILRHLGVGPDRIEIVTADARGREDEDSPDRGEPDDAAPPCRRREAPDLLALSTAAVARASSIGTTAEP